MEHEFDPRDLEPSLPSDEGGGRKWRAGPIVIAGIALVGFGGLLWYSYTLGHRDTASGVAPLIKADAGPTKVKPDDPGGLDVPNQDKLVLNNLAGGDSSSKNTVEHLMPAPEAPIAPPPPPSPPVASNSNVPPAIAPAPPKSTPALIPAPTVDKSQPPAPAAVPRSAVGSQPLAGSTPAVTTPNPPTQIASAAPPPAAKPQKVPVPAAIAPGGPAPAIPTPATPAVATPAPAPAKPAKTASAGGYRVQLAAVRSQDQATAEWGKLQKTNPELGPLQLNVVQVELPEKGTFYRVQAGPLSDQGSADQLCSALKARSQGCIVVHP